MVRYTRLVDGAGYEGMGNPFEDTGKDLLILDTREIVDPSVVYTMQTLECLSKEQSHEFMKSRLVKSRIDLLTDPIKKISSLS